MKIPHPFLELKKDIHSLWAILHTINGHYEYLVHLTGELEKTVFNLKEAVKDQWEVDTGYSLGEAHYFLNLTGMGVVIIGESWDELHKLIIAEATKLAQSEVA